MILLCIVMIQNINKINTENKCLKTKCRGGSMKIRQVLIRLPSSFVNDRTREMYWIFDTYY